MYEQAKSQIKIINEPFFILLPLLHVNKALLIAHFLFDVLEQNKFRYNVILGLQVAVVLYIYYLAARVSKQVYQRRFYSGFFIR